MLQLTYSGQWRKVSARNPEDLTIFAPEALQKACTQFGGKTPSGKPNFRLVLVSSRFQIAKGNVTVLDDNKNYVSNDAQESLLPRYHVPKEFHGLYCLEMWLSPEQQKQMGYGEDPEQEPLWPEGVYEAIWYGPGIPLSFPMDVSIESIQRAIWAVGKLMELAIEDDKARRRTLAMRNEEIRRKAEEKEDLLYELKQKRRVNVGDPMISLAGVDMPIKGDL